MISFPTRIPDCDSPSPALWICFFLPEYLIYSNFPSIAIFSFKL